MQPLQLTLKGFRGIRDGLGLDEIHLDLERLADGAQLVAITGPNGSGKTTVMDNLTPYMQLPSRASAGPGGFSYYDHVYLPESTKELVWAHAGQSYRSQIVIRLNGRRRTEAFLHVLDSAGHWRPARLADGTLSDGRVESYNACVEGICGSAETFFTSVFSAQAKRQLNSYRNAEIKALLADLLGQDEIRAVGQRAAETARILKVGLGGLRQQLAGLALDDERLRHARDAVSGADGKLAAAENCKQLAQVTLDSALARQARLAAEHERLREVEQQRERLEVERSERLRQHAAIVSALDARDRAEAGRQERLTRRIDARQRQEQERRRVLEQLRARHVDQLQALEVVEHAARRLALARQVAQLRRSRAEHCRAQVGLRDRACAAVQHAELQLAAIEREAGRAAIHADELARRFGLTEQVPCAGSTLQGRCHLLADARDAHALLPDARALVARCTRQKGDALRVLAAAQSRVRALGDVDQASAWADFHASVADERALRFTGQASRLDGCHAARDALVEVDAELAALPPPAVPAVRTPEEQAEANQIAASRSEVAAQTQQERRELERALVAIDGALAKLPDLVAAAALSACATDVDVARASVNAAQAKLLAAVRSAQTLRDLQHQQSHLASQTAQIRMHAGKVEEALSCWTLLARCMSHDGLIALAIDDAGPTLARLANDLLLACFGPRFTVAIHTLVESTKGDAREGFDIVVHDGTTGNAKSVALMSGGEKTWVEACLTRAIALYLAMHTGRRYDTLFSDEADGALDPQRKRMFMATKREVLRLGGYAREYFVTQTPQLVAMADAVIDLEAFQTRIPSS
jgi:exonuclease SbcC